ncbi:MAG TPA: hypothetical protein DCL38_06025 [Lachnospiraceae bacterium]|nr:hypothetical protein [Lachnospiraceae bacterium]
MKDLSLQNSTETEAKHKITGKIAGFSRITYVTITFVIVMAFALTGCNFIEKAADRFRKAAGLYKDETGGGINVVSVEEPEYFINITDDEAEWNSFDNAARLSGNALTSLRIDELSNTVSGYCYMMLSGEEKELYDVIHDLLVNFKEDIVLPTVDTDMIDHAFTCVLIDHPEIFYVKGYSIKTYTRDGKVERIAMSGTYTMNESQVASLTSELDDYFAGCADTIPENADEYAKVKAVYEYIIRNTEYDLRTPNNQNVLSVFVGNRSVCQGYAKATQYILNRLGIFCTLVEGVVRENEAHVWDLVRIDGDYYHVDTTWGDASYKLVSGNDENGLPEPPEINYDYLCITTDEILKTHTIREVVPLMECGSIRDNYYVREGLYFTLVDDEGLKKAFSRAYDEGMLTITLKCSDDEVYEDMTEYLLNDQKVFNYLRESTVNYVTVEEQREIILYL